MQTGNLLLLLVALAGLTWYLGFRRSHAVAAPLGGIRHLHSLPSYYAMLATVWAVIPALVLLGVWLAIDDTVIRYKVMGALPADVVPADKALAGLLLDKIQNVASGALPASFVEPFVVTAAEHLNALREANANMLTALFIAVVVLG